MVLLGLDFGTTFSTVCCYANNELHVFKQQNSATIPTFVFLHADRQNMAYGYDAESLLHAKEVSGALFRDLKRWVGCDESNIEEYKSLIKPHYSVSMVKYGNGSKLVPVIGSYSGNVSLSGNLCALIALFVKALVSSAAEAFRSDCTGVIVSVPANYNSLQRSFTENCVSLSGITCVHMVNEPSAAALATCGKVDMKPRNLLVYDFGGGTFDVSIISSRNQTFTVRASGGDMNLGGRDVDREFRKRLYDIARLPVDEEFDVSSLKESLSRTMTPIKYTIKSSSGASSVILVQPDLLTQVMLPFVDRTIKVMKEVYDKYKVSMGSTSEDIKMSLVLVGGSSYLPGLKTLLLKTPMIGESIDLPDPRTAVAAGCAIYSSCLSARSAVLLVDCASHNLSIQNLVGESIVCVPAGAPIPFNGTRTISLAGCTSTATYEPRLFEGDYNKCAYNKMIYYGSIALSEIGVGSAKPITIPITLDIQVSSVGTVKFYISGPSNTKLLVGGIPAYSFSHEVISSRSVADLRKNNSDRVLLYLSLVRTPTARKRLTSIEKENLDETLEIKDLQKTLKSYSGYDEPTTEVCKLLLGKSVQKILRGARVEKILF